MATFAKKSITMKHLNVFIFCILAFNSFFSSAQTQTAMPMPGQTSVFTGNVRGYYFVAPSCFTLTGAMIPTDASSAEQNIAIVRFNTPPPIYSTTTNDFTLLYLTQNNTNPGILPLNIQIEQGDIIGVLGQRSNVNSYSSSGNTTTINGQTVTLNRLGMQFSLATTTPQQLWTESATNISRVNLYYDTLITNSISATNLSTNSFNFANTADTSFLSVWNYGDGSSLDTTDNASHVYSNSGTYNVCSYITNSCGVDTICTSVNVCVPTFESQNITLCNGLGYTVGSNTYYVNGVYSDTLTSVFGCDSIIETNLTVLPTNSISQSISICSGESFTVGTSVYVTNGIYSDTLINASGCDSIVETNLTVLPASAFAQTINLCFGESYTINGNTYSSSGSYSDTLTNYLGCDSIVTTQLSIDNQINSTVQLNGITLTAVSGYQYQWIDCSNSSPINGATSTSFNPTQNGSYAVILSTLQGCSDTSACTSVSTIGIGENNSNFVTVYPNPAHSEIFIEAFSLNGKIEIKNTLGQVVLESEIVESKKIAVSHLESGMYYVVFTALNGEVYTKELIIE